MPVVTLQSAKRFAVESLSEGFLGVLFLGKGTINPQKLEALLNKRAGGGWYVAGMFTEKKRKLLFWSLDTVIVVFAKDHLEEA